MVFSDEVMKNKDWLKGSGSSDTFTLNPHKLLGVPLQCSMLLTPHKGHLLFAKANSLQAEYLFHDNPYDLGAGTIGCGRRPDATKVFLAWKFYGKEGLGDRVDRALQITDQFTDIVRQRKGFVLVQDPSSFLQICFWFVPSAIQKVNDEILSKITKELHKRVNLTGEFLVDRSPLIGVPDFFRVVVNAPTVSLHRDLERLLDLIEEEASTVDWNLVLS